MGGRQEIRLLQNGNKFCPRCEEYKSLNEFHKNKGNEYGASTYCKLCRMERHYIDKYGVKKEEVLSQKEKQENKCGICQQLLGEKYCVDHNHRTNKVRGIICFKCNQVLGYSGDNIDILAKAIEYLRKGTIWQ